MAVPGAGDSGVTVAERLHLKLAELTPAERKVARALLAEYPVRGLQPVAKLAATAGVSAPTVIGLSQAVVRQLCRVPAIAEVRGLGPAVVPADRPARRSAADHGDVLSRAEQVFCDGIRSSSFARLPRSEFERAVRLLAEPRRSVTVIGGRFGWMLAEIPGGEPADAAR
jgi:hypothetical protein